MSTVTATVKERPILMHARSIRGILEGRKRQTRRIIKGFEVRGPHPPGLMDLYRIGGPGVGWCGAFKAGDSSGSSAATHCPYGKPGDRLWVRETLKCDELGTWRYTDGAEVVLDVNDPNASAMVSWAHHKDSDHCVSIHMPRWASRLTLEITDVRVERVQEISEADCAGEGVTEDSNEYDSALSLRENFSVLWEQTNGKGAWERNDWCWVISFKKVEAQ